MKKILLLAILALQGLTLSAITTDDLCGEWKTTVSVNEDLDFDGTFQTTTKEGTCTISKADDGSLSIKNLLGSDWTFTTTANFATTTNGLLLQPATCDCGGVEMTFAGTTSNTEPVMATISDGGKTISISGWCFWYDTDAYATDGTVTLTSGTGGDDDPQPVVRNVLWYRNGTAWDSNSNKIGKVQVVAYEDGSYAVIDWMGAAGYNLEFTLVPGTKYTVIQPTNTYQINTGYYYVSGGAQTDSIYSVGMYISGGYSNVYGPDWTTTVSQLDPEGGYLYIWAYAYDGADVQKWGGYYTVSWGPDYSVDVNPVRNSTMEYGQGQTSHIDMMRQDTYTATLEVFPDNYYILKNWQGVEGYDLRFTLGNQDSITVLNEDAQEVVTAKGSRYWRVPTGNSQYDRACVYQNSPVYNTFHLSSERVYVTFGCSYLYPVGSTKGAKAYYSVRGFDPDRCDTVSLRECTWSNQQNCYVDTVSFNLKGIKQVQVYTLDYQDTDSIYYCVPDFLGPMTGDLYFALTDSTAERVTIENAVQSGLYYYYIHYGTADTYDNICPAYYWTSNNEFLTNDGSLVIDLWYTDKDGNGCDTYYCLNLPYPEEEEDEDAIHAIVSQVAQQPAVYDLSGRQVKQITYPGIYIQGGRKYLRK